MSRGLMFHHISGPGHPAVQGSVSLDDFQRILDKHWPTLCNAQNFLSAHVINGLDPEDEVLTFDDGLSSQWLAEPILRERGLTAFWFVPTAPLIGVASRLEIWRWIRTQCFPTMEAFYDAFWATLPADIPRYAPAGYLRDHTYLSSQDRAFRRARDHGLTALDYERAMERVEQMQWAREVPIPTRAESLRDRWLSEGQLRTLWSQGHVIGMHSHSHPTTLATLTHEAQEVEYMTATWILEALYDRPTAMSHPCNEYSAHGLQYLTRLGYVLGFRATPLVAEWGPLEVPRVDSADLVKAL